MNKTKNFKNFNLARVKWRPANFTFPKYIPTNFDEAQRIDRETNLFERESPDGNQNSWDSYLHPDIFDEENS